MTEQLTFDFDLAAATERLADRIRDYRVIPAGSAERLLKALVVRTELDERALLPAAALVLELEYAAARKASAIGRLDRTSAGRSEAPL